MNAGWVDFLYLFLQMPPLFAETVAVLRAVRSLFR